MGEYFDTGMLGLIKGEHIIEALQSLPPAELANADTIDVEHEVPEIGRVRFTARRKLAKHHMTVLQLWSASRAVLVGK